MSGVLRQSTSTVLSFGPFVSPTDGVTLVTSLVSALDNASTGIFLSKNGGALTIRHAAVTASTYDSYGNYLVTLDTTDTGTVGRLRVQFTAAASCLPVWQDFDVITRSVYDALFGSTAAFPANFPLLTIDVNGHTTFANTVTVKKNTALNALPFTMTDSNNHAPLAGLTVTATRSLDGAGFAACANAVAEVGSGDYKIDLADTDLNAGTVMLRFAATGADDLNIAFVTQP